MLVSWVLDSPTPTPRQGFFAPLGLERDSSKDHFESGTSESPSTLDHSLLFVYLNAKNAFPLDAMSHHVKLGCRGLRRAIDSRVPFHFDRGGNWQSIWKCPTVAQQKYSEFYIAHADAISFPWGFRATLTPSTWSKRFLASP